MFIKQQDLPSFGNLAGLGKHVLETWRVYEYVLKKLQI